MIDHPSSTRSSIGSSSPNFSRKVISTECSLQTYLVVTTSMMVLEIYDMRSSQVLNGP